MSAGLATLLFFVVALIYSAAGFGGGSSYTALLTLSELRPAWIASVSLACNILVVAGSLVHFARRGHVDLRLAWPLLLASVPCAFLGGRWPLRETVFMTLLGISLVGAGTALLAQPNRRAVQTTAPGIPIRLATGAVLGLLSGLVGIGGGVFLAPVLLLRRWAEPKQVAGVSALFILVNSVAGLAGQLTKLGTVAPLAHHWMLFAAVLLGGQLGSMLGAGPFPQRFIRILTGALVASAGLRVLFHLQS